MAEENKDKKVEELNQVSPKTVESKPVVVSSNAPVLMEKKKIIQRRVQKMERPNTPQKKKEFESEIISIRRVTKVTSGGKRMRMSVFLVMGDKKGRVGLGIGKGSDVRSAEAKALDYAKKRMVTINLKGTTVPHTVTLKYGSAKIFMKPAAPGTGVIAGGPVRKVLEVSGVKDILTKQIGSSNQISNAYATIEALKMMKLRVNEIK